MQQHLRLFEPAQVLEQQPEVAQRGHRVLMGLPERAEAGFERAAQQWLRFLELAHLLQEHPEVVRGGERVVVSQACIPD